MLRRHKESASASDSTFYQLRPDCAHNVPDTKFKIKIGKTLSVRKWHAAFTHHGSLHIASVLTRIQSGGVHPAIRGEVWEFLLGCFHPESTFDDRDHIRQARRIQYARWKEQCKHMDPHVGSGKIITAPIITEDGVPIKDPLVLLEATPDQQGSSTSSRNGDEADESSANRLTDKQTIEWKLTLHQIDVGVQEQEIPEACFYVETADDQE